MIKAIAYNPETHMLLARTASVVMQAAMEAQWEAGSYVDMAKREWGAAIAAAPQPEPVDVGSVGWKHVCVALCANDIELWIDRCPHCGKPRHNHTPTDDELLNKAEQVESEPVAWCLAYNDPNFKLRIHRNPTMCEAEIDAHVKGLNGELSKAPLYTTPQPDRVAELEAALKVARDGIDEFLVANDQTEFGCACDLSVGYLCGPCHADKQQQPLKSALAKINEVLK